MTPRSTNSSLTKRDKYLRLTYDITEVEYKAMLKTQRYRCGACSRHQSEFKTRLAVDHDHRTGIIRGLLCYHCNRWVIGKHRPEKIHGASDYLAGWPASLVIGERKVPERRKRGRNNPA